MREVDHLAIHAQRPGLRIGLERGDDLARMRYLGFGRRVSAIDDRDLIGMNRQAPGETVAPRAPAIPLEPLGIAEIRVERVDGYDFSGGGGEQALRPRQLIRKRPRPIRLLVVGRAERRREVLRAPG